MTNSFIVFNNRELDKKFKSEKFKVYIVYTTIANLKYEVIQIQSDLLLAVMSTGMYNTWHTDVASLPG